MIHGKVNLTKKNKQTNQNHDSDLEFNLTAMWQSATD